MSRFTTNLITVLLLPPMSLLLLLALAILMLQLYPQIALFLFSSVFLLLWISSTAYFAEGGLRFLETKTTALQNPLPIADAIIILGGGSYFHAPEYAHQDTVNEATLVRLRYGAWLHRHTQQAILVTGGKPKGNRVSEALQMQVVLEQDFQVPVRWIEGAANDSLESATNCFQMLQQESIKKIYLVTHAWHMPRSSSAFQHAGFEVIEAPIAFTTRYQTDLFTFIPNAQALFKSRVFFHELLGIAWNKLKT